MSSSKKSILTITGVTLFTIIYIMYIVFPFLHVNAPANESSLTWTYNLAPFHYALILYPVIFIYVFFVSKNILKIRYCRWIIYPICFSLIFVLAHMSFFIFSMVVLWFCLVTIPIGLILLLAIEIFAIVLDIKDYKNKEAEKNTNNIQIILNSISCIVVPIFLMLGILSALVVVNNEPKESNKECKNLYNAIQLSNSEFDNINKLSFQKIAEYYKKDFNNTKKYENYFGSFNRTFNEGNYVESIGQSDGSWISQNVNWINFNLINNNNEIVSFSFEKKNICMKNSENCMWHLHNTKHDCSFFVNEDNSITPTKQTAIFLKQK